MGVIFTLEHKISRRNFSVKVNYETKTQMTLTKSVGYSL
jgi:hypothetical protein